MQRGLTKVKSLREFSGIPNPGRKTERCYLEAKLKNYLSQSTPLLEISFGTLDVFFNPV